MGIPAQQIGWSQKAKLLWSISKQFEKLTAVMSKNSTTTTTSSTTLSTTTTTTTAAPGSYAYGVTTSGYVDRPTACAASIGIPFGVYAATSDPSAVTQLFNDAGLTTPHTGDNTSYYVYFKSSAPSVKYTANISSTNGTVSSKQICP